MKISIIGTGSIGKRHLKNCVLLKDELGLSEITCYDTNKDRLKQLSEEVPGVRATGQLEEAVKKADALIICVPTSRHIPVISEISKTGRFHIYLEKPMSHTIEGCDELVFAQKRAGRVLAMGYMLPKHPVLLKTKEIIQGGALGRILSVRAEAGLYLPKWHPWEDYRDFYMSWKTGGGGALLDISHEIHYLQWFFGDIAEVKGYVGQISDLEISSDDIVTALFQFKNGIYGELHLDLLQFNVSRFCKIIGTEGVLIADLPTKTIRYHTKDNESWNESKFDIDFDTIYHDQLRDFVAACQGKQTSLIMGESGLKTMQVIEGIRRSHAYSTTVKVPLFD
ncbi:MAG: Gfo/Idh/MocA family oxidoreductase [Candidatus Aureabacteria bacterium]|nr:Gfo/Idh/MocA family oxidoreductase [Candidatus Auribacterota bacterium]